jgi:hypothetical protein
MIGMKDERRRLPKGQVWVSPVRIEEMTYRRFLAKVAMSGLNRDEIIRAFIGIYLEGKIDSRIAALVEEERKAKEK